MGEVLTPRAETLFADRACGLPYPTRVLAEILVYEWPAVQVGGCRRFSIGSLSNGRPLGMRQSLDTQRFRLCRSQKRDLSARRRATKRLQSQRYAYHLSTHNLAHVCSAALAPEGLAVGLRSVALVHPCRIAKQTRLTGAINSVDLSASKFLRRSAATLLVTRYAQGLKTSCQSPRFPGATSVDIRVW